MHEIECLQKIFGTKYFRQKCIDESFAQNLLGIELNTGKNNANYGSCCL